MKGLLLIIGILALAVLCSGCTGKLYVGYDRTDHVTETRVMVEKPWYCSFISCPVEGK